VYCPPHVSLPVRGKRVVDGSRVFARPAEARTSAWVLVLAWNDYRKVAWTMRVSTTLNGTEHEGAQQ
jgi:hypothetical protein